MKRGRNKKVVPGAGRARGAASAKREGLRIRGNDADREVRQAVVKFARWLRAEHEFPIRVQVYLYSAGLLSTRAGLKVSASFFAPFSTSVEPYIRVATGDYASLKASSGRDNALAAILCSVAHEIVHYHQWRNGKPFSERGAVRQAGDMVRRYALTTSHP